jgi:hypothetical protein
MVFSSAWLSLSLTVHNRWLRTSLAKRTILSSVLYCTVFFTAQRYLDALSIGSFDAQASALWMPATSDFIGWNVPLVGIMKVCWLLLKRRINKTYVL